MKDKNLRSVFEVYKVGAGPSSSHSMGPQRAAALFLQRCGENKPALVRVTLLGSLAATGRGHFTDHAILLALGKVPSEIIWDEKAEGLPHPNTLRFQAIDKAGVSFCEWTVSSIGGGALADAQGQIGVVPPVHYPVQSVSAALKDCLARGIPFSAIVEQVETDLYPRLGAIWDRMKEAVVRGLAAGNARLPGTLGVRRKAAACRERADKLASPERDIALMSAFALAVSEENAAGGQVVTAPSCGAAGIVPAVLYYYELVKKSSRTEILRALATAGFFGSVIRAHASVSGAEVGCQGEVGSACSMAAAAAAQLNGGTPKQVEYAAEVAMEHHLGLTCDPIEGYVQIPCIERNMSGALRAFEAATYAMLDDGKHLISFDAVLQAMYETGKDMGEAYRETARGGLAKVWRRRVGSLSVTTDVRAQCD